MSEDSNSGVIEFPIFSFDELEEKTHDTENIGNNEWALSAYPYTDETKKTKYLAVELLCNKDFNSNLWSCNASVRFTLKKLNPAGNGDAFSVDYVKRFCKKDHKIEIPKFKKWDDVANPSNHFIMENKVCIEVSITVNSNHGFNKVVLETFDEPKENLTDVVLLVEGKKVHVGKQILALHSRYFQALFFSDFKESTETEIPIEDVVHWEFIDLLNQIYPTHEEIDYVNLDHVLKLADRFVVWSVIEKVEKFLIDAKYISINKKLKLAETYKLGRLQAHCCDKLTTRQQIMNLVKEKHYDQLGDVTLSLLFQKLVEIDE